MASVSHIKVAVYYLLQKLCWNPIGCKGMSLLYDSVFSGEVRAIAGIDFIMSMPEKRKDISEYWREGIDGFIKTEDHLANDEEKNRYSDKTPLTREKAVSM
jgi:hypothetical protein